MIPEPGQPRSLQRRRLVNRSFLIFCIVVTSLSILSLGVLLVSITIQGLEHLDLDFVKNPASRKPEKAGVFASLWGTVWICIVCALSALPIGVGTAIYLEEFAKEGRIRRFIDLNISNLAGVPSIVYGIIGLTVFARMFGLFGSINEPAIEIGDPYSFWYFRLPFGGAVLVGGLVLMLVVLPIVIVSAREALRSVPSSLREAALAAGATRWQMVRRITLPAALPGIMTGSILAISRAIGEAAPLLVVSGVLYIRFAPENLMDQFTAMPLQIYNWAGRPQEEFHAVAATGIMVLLAILLLFNTIAIIIRQVFQKPLQ
ncbi:MAG: phosphate ABC transporter permease PstA [Planctomycetota bacterium]|nr:phosphate ABC transporter permease PstA [Planctomycetota bacterium]